MAQKHFVVGIDWFGPYSLQKAQKAAKEDYLGGLYLCVGKQKGEHKKRPQYVGKSTDKLWSRMKRDHKKLCRVTRNREIWLGEIVTGDVPGRRKRLTPESIRLSEWAIAFYMKLPLNEKLRKLPERPVTVLNRWWRSDHYDVPRKRRPHPSWPDVIDFRGKPYSSRLVWFRAPGLKLETTS